MKVLLINGSPKPKGSTYTMLQEIAVQLDKDGIGSEVFHIGSKPISGCIACGGCKAAGRCVVKDDVIDPCTDKLREADGVIIGTPVYYSGANGSLCALLDRLFYSDREDRFVYKPGAAVAVSRRAGAATALDRINKYFLIKRMPVVPSQYWALAFGHNGDEVRQDAEGLQILRTLAQNMAWLLKCIDYSKQACPPPAIEKPERTNFIR